MPLAIVELRSASHTHKYICFADLHHRDAIFQGQNKPVISVFGVPVENCALRVKRPYLKGRLDAAEIEQNGFKFNRRLVHGKNKKDSRQLKFSMVPFQIGVIHKPVYQRFM